MLTELRKKLPDYFVRELFFLLALSTAETSIRPKLHLAHRPYAVPRDHHRSQHFRAGGDPGQGGVNVSPSALPAPSQRVRKIKLIFAGARIDQQDGFPRVALRRNTARNMVASDEGLKKIKTIVLN
jgi:hypothetical protein